MSQPVTTKPEKRKSLSNQVRAMLSKNTVAPPDGYEVYGLEHPAQKLDSPNMVSPKKRRPHQGVLTPPNTPYKFPSATPVEITARPSKSESRQPVQRTRSAPKRSNRINKITSDSAPLSPSDWQDLERNKIHSGPTTTTTTTVTAKTTATTGAVTQGHGPTSTSLNTSTVLARTTSVKTVSQTVAKTKLPEAFQTPSASPTKSGESKHVKSISSPARIQKPKQEAESAQESDIPAEQTAKPKLITWVQKGRNDSKQFHLQFDELGELLVPKTGAELAPEEVKASNTSRNPSTTKKSPRKLSHQRRSTHLPKRSYVVSKPPVLAYPQQAKIWISETHYSRLSREAQVMVAGFSAVKDLYEMGSKTFGAEWSFPIGHDEPLRNWAQRGETLRGPLRECEYFCSGKDFETLYANGGLTQHFEVTMKAVKNLPAGAERVQSIRKLAKQGDHVVNLALETLQSLTLRTDYTPKEVIQVWDCMLHESPGRKELGYIRAYLDQHCVTVQAFVNAILWQFETIGQHMPPRVPVRDALKTFYFFATHFLGYPLMVFQKLKAKHTLDQINEALTIIGAKDMVAQLTELANKRKDALSLLSVAKSLAPHEETNSGFGSNRLGITSVSQALLTNLANGDQRFANAFGLSSITDPQPVTLPTEPSGAAPSAVTGLSSHPMPPSTMELPPLPPPPGHANQ